MLSAIVLLRASPTTSVEHKAEASDTSEAGATTTTYRTNCFELRQARDALAASLCMSLGACAWCLRLLLVFGRAGGFHV